MHFEDLGGFCIFTETAKVGIFLFEFGNFIDEVQFTKVQFIKEKTMKSKKTLIFLIIITLLATTIAIPMNVMAVPSSFEGVSITYRTTDVENVFALDFRVHGVPASGYQVWMEFNNEEVEFSTPNGGNVILIGQAITSMTNGDADLTGLARDVSNSDPERGWAFQPTLTRLSDNSFSATQLMLQAVMHPRLYEQFGVRTGVLGTFPSEVRDFSITPPESGLNLFSIYFRMRDGRTLDDVNRYTVMAMSAPDADTGIMIAYHGHRIANGIMWIDFPGKTDADNDPGESFPPPGYTPQQPGNGGDNGNGNGNGNQPGPGPGDGPGGPGPGGPGPGDNVIIDDGLLETEIHFRYIFGYEDNTFRPDNNISREETATIFFRLLTSYARGNYRTTDNTFPDVEYSRWSAMPTGTMQNIGVIMGDEAGYFRPAGQITRAEFAAIIVRFHGVSGSAINDFDDVDEHWAERYIATASQNGWITGFPDNTFAPNQPITRAEAVTLINRALGRRVNATGLLQELLPNFTDLTQSHWAFFEIMEASVSHEYTRGSDGRTEIWTGPGIDIDFDIN